MSMPKWLAVARNEYRVQTCRVRRFRRDLPVLLVAVLALHVAYIAPAIVGLASPQILSALLSQAALAMVQVIMFTVFVYFLIIPLTETLRDIRSGELEMVLASPIRPGQLLFGQFLGDMSMYSVFVVIVAGFFTAALAPLGLSGLQVLFVVVAFVLVSLCAFWIGSVIAALCRSRLERISAGRDIGAGISMLLALPVVGLIYALMGGGLMRALENPETSKTVVTVLGCLPSSWASRMIVEMATHPGDLSSCLHIVAARLGYLVVFALAAVWVGMKLADRAYTMEQTSFGVSRVKKDGWFFRVLVRMSGGYPFGTILSSVFKDYIRRLQNISTLTYMLGILFMMNVFLLRRPAGPQDAPGQIMMTLFILPIVATMATGGATVEGKEKIFLYRKAPAGLRRYLASMLLKGMIVTVPIAAAVTFITEEVVQGTSQALLVTPIVAVLASGYVVMVLGLFLLRPAFSERSVSLWINVMLAVFLSVSFFLLALLILTSGGKLPEPVGGLAYVIALQTILIWALGCVLLSAGARKIALME